MKFECTFHVHLHLDPDVIGLVAGIAKLLERTETMSEQLDTLTTEVSEATTVMGSAVILINGFAQQLRDAIAAGNPEALTALSASLDASANALAAAVAANTPAAPPVP